MKKTMMIGITLAAIFSAGTLAAQQTTYRSGSGSFTGTATKQGSQTTYRGSSGQFKGTATERGNTTT